MGPKQRVWISYDEYYPFFSFTVSWTCTRGKQCEVSGPTLRRWQRTMKSFKLLQDELEQLSEK